MCPGGWGQERGKITWAENYWPRRGPFLTVPGPTTASGKQVLPAPLSLLLARPPPQLPALSWGHTLGNVGTLESLLQSPPCIPTIRPLKSPCSSDTVPSNSTVRTPGMRPHRHFCALPLVNPASPPPREAPSLGGARTPIVRLSDCRTEASSGWRCETWDVGEEARPLFS